MYQDDTEYAIRAAAESGRHGLSMVLIELRATVISAWGVCLLGIELPQVTLGALCNARQPVKAAGSTVDS